MDVGDIYDGCWWWMDVGVGCDVGCSRWMLVMDVGGGWISVLDVVMDVAME